MTTFWELLRIHQWLKNLMLLFPPFLGGAFDRLASAPQVVVPLLSFCCASSALYIVNDLFDIQQDRQHPLKSQRPLASGKICPEVAKALAVVLFAGAVASGFFVSLPFLLVLFSYLAVSLSYSAFLKKVPLVEIFCIVSGFLFRLEAGGLAYRVKISNWLFLSVFLLAIFLVCGKRLGEIRAVKGARPELVRPVLAKYPQGFLEGGLYISGAGALVTYTLYVINHQGNILLIPLCCFGLLSYLFRVFSGKGGDPTRALLKDPSLLIIGLLWVALVALDLIR